MQIFKKIAGVMIALLIGAGTLFLLLRTFNKVETKKTSFSERKYELIKAGDLESFPEWNEIAEFPPKSVMRYYGIEDEEIRFDSKYTIDDETLRVEESSPELKSSHLLVGGCSFIFGTAINSNETLTSHLREKLPHVNTVNLGHGGGGLHTQLRIFDLIKMKKRIPENTGTYVYVFYHDHINRWKAFPTYLQWAQEDDIHYKIKKGKLVHERLKNSPEYKSFLDAKKAGLEMVYIRSKSTNHEWNSEDLRDFAHGVKILKENYLKLFPEGRFVVAFHPHSDPSIGEKISPYFDEFKIEHHPFHIKFNDYVYKSKLPREHFIVPLDGHPNTNFNEFLAKELIATLGLSK